MKSQSFEYQLRHAVPPAPDGEAQQRAKRAALAEFARIHGAQNEAAGVASAPETRASRKKVVRWPWTRSSRDAWLGGFATACLLIVGVSIVWLLPPRDREVSLNVPMAQQEADSRIYAGIHYRFDNEVSQEYCPKIADQAFATLAKPR